MADDNSELAGVPFRAAVESSVGCSCEAYVSSMDKGPDPHDRSTWGGAFELSCLGRRWGVHYSRVPSRLGGLAFDGHCCRRCSRARRAQAAPWKNLLGVVRWALRRAGDGVGGVARGARGSAVELIVPSAKPPSRAPASRARKVLQGPLQARSALRRRAPSLFPPETRPERVSDAGRAA